jgi:hypothetical protein
MDMDRQARLERRRLIAASGAMPVSLAGKFTLGQDATLCVIADEYRTHGCCDLSLDEIADKASVGFAEGARARPDHSAEPRPPDKRGADHRAGVAGVAATGRRGRRSLVATWAEWKLSLVRQGSTTKQGATPTPSKRFKRSS